MSVVHRKCDASNYETKQLVICSSVKMLSTTGETAGWSIEGVCKGVKSCQREGRGEARGNWHGHGTTLLRVPTRKILWQLVNKPQLPSSRTTATAAGQDKGPKNQQSQKQILPKNLCKIISQSLRCASAHFFGGPPGPGAGAGPPLGLEAA